MVLAISRKNNEVHFWPRSITVAVYEDNNNNWDEKTDTIIVANYALGHNSQKNEVHFWVIKHNSENSMFF